MALRPITVAMTGPSLARLRNFFRHAWFEQLAFAPVWLLLGLARLAIGVLPFERLASGLGTAMDTRVVVPLLSGAQERRAHRVSCLVAWTAAHTPWTSNCFPQALVARALLGLAGVPWALCLGVQRDASGALAAHAWVTAGRVAVTGGANVGRFAVVACFTSLADAEPRAVRAPR